MKLQQFALSLIILTFVCSFKGHGQDEDLKLWTRVSVKYDLTTKTRLAVEEEFRFYNNASSLEENHTEIGISHELSDNWEGGLFYRFIYETDPQDYYSLGHRGWFQLAYKWQWGNIKGSIRERLQGTFQDYMSSENGKIPENYLRSKISLTYEPIKGNIEPYIGGEFWYTLGTGDPAIIDKMRIGGGIEYRRNKNVRLDFFYNYQKDLQVARPDTGHIFGIAYAYIIR